MNKESSHPEPSGKPAGDKPSSQPGADEGTNRVEHEPDPAAQPIPDGEHKYIKRSPYTAGND